MNSAALPLLGTSGRLGFEKLIWLFPIMFVPHLVEEYTGDFSHYVATAMGGFVMPGPVFLANNAAFMLILISLCVGRLAALTTFGVRPDLLGERQHFLGLLLSLLLHRRLGALLAGLSYRDAVLLPSSAADIRGGRPPASPHSTRHVDRLRDRPPTAIADHLGRRPSFRDLT